MLPNCKCIITSIFLLLYDIHGRTYRVIKSIHLYIWLIMHNAAANRCIIYFFSYTKKIPAQIFKMKFHSLSFELLIEKHSFYDKGKSDSLFFSHSNSVVEKWKSVKIMI